jgi:hypothetical protein
MEIKKIVEMKKDPEVIKKATENYQEEVEKIKEEADKIKEKAKENPEIDKFLDKYTQQQILHQRLLEKLAEQVPADAFAKIKEAREMHLERFGEVMTKLEDRGEKIEERLEKNTEELRGSQFKNFKNLEILIELEKKVPEEAKEAIRKAQENVAKRLGENLEKMSSEDQEKFKDYIENISGDTEKHLEALENLKSELKPAPEMPQAPETRRLERKLEEIRVKLLPLKGVETAPSQPEEPPCAQVITYKIQNDKCYRCPDACSPIERCEEVSMEECQKEESLIPKVKESPEE